MAHLELRGDRLYLSNRNPDRGTEFDVSGEEPVALDDHPCGAFPVGGTAVTLPPQVINFSSPGTHPVGYASRRP